MHFFPFWIKFISKKDWHLNLSNWSLPKFEFSWAYVKYGVWTRPWKSSGKPVRQNVIGLSPYKSSF